jgi:hypothetical protein
MGARECDALGDDEAEELDAVGEQKSSCPESGGCAEGVIPVVFE